MSKVAVKETKEKVSKEDTKKSTQKESTQKEKEPTKEQQKATKETSKVSTKEDTKKTPAVEQSEEEETFNKSTRKAGLKFDVNTRKKWLKAHFERFPIPVMESVDVPDGKKKVKRQEVDEDGNPRTEFVGCAGAQYALSSVEQVLCSHLVGLAFPRATKTKSNLYEINGALLMDTLRNDPEMNVVFGTALSSYDTSADYFSQLKIAKKDEINTYVEKYCLDNGSVQLTSDGLNFLMFVFQRNRVLLSDCAFRMVEYARKKTVCEDAIMCAVKVHYARAPLLCDKLLKKFEAVSGLVEEAQKVEREEKEKKAAAKKKAEDEKKSSNKKDKKSKKDDSDSSDSDADKK